MSSTAVFAGKKDNRPGGPPPTTPAIKVQNVNYDADGSQVIIKGKLDHFGAAADVTVTYGAGAVVLGETSTSKQFRFKLPTGGDLPVPCAVTITAGDLAVTEDVRNAPETCGLFTRTLSGLVTDGPIPFATVSVTLDGATYTTVADENGFYELEIFATTVKKLVKVEASGADPETGTPVDFVNFAGSFERIIDGEPENVTNVTTASYALAVEANGGTEPQTLEELQAAETAIDATELFELAAVIKLIVDNPTYDLPAGYDNILDFIADEGAVDAFVAAANPQDIEDTVAEILADSDLVAGFEVADIPARYFAIPTANPGFLARQGEVLEFNQSDSTGVILSFVGPSGQAIEQSFAWGVNGGRLEIFYDSPVTTISFPGANTDIATPEQVDLLTANGIFQVEQIRATTQTVYTRVTAGALVDVVAVEEIVEISYPPIEVTDPDTGLPVTIQLAGSTEFNNTTDTLRSDANIQPTPLVADCATATAGEVCVPGRWGGVYRYSAGEQFGFVFPTTSYGEVITFDPAGTASGAISGAASSWSVVDGSLVISYPDGAEQKITLLDSLGIEYGALSEYTTPAGRFASYNIWVKAETPFDLSESYLQTAPGKYWQGDVNTWIPGNLDENGERPFFVFFGWTFDAAPDPNEGENVSRVSSLTRMATAPPTMYWHAAPIPGSCSRAA